MTMYALVDARACESTYMCTRAYDTHTHAFYVSNNNGVATLSINYHYR